MSPSGHLAISCSALPSGAVRRNCRKTLERPRPVCWPACEQDEVTGVANPTVLVLVPEGRTINTVFEEYRTPYDDALDTLLRTLNAPRLLRLGL